MLKILIAFLWCNAHSVIFHNQVSVFVPAIFLFHFLHRYFSSESSIFDNNGVSVIATTSETNNETIKAIPSGFNIRPSIPERKNNGRNATIIINVALRMEALISFDASNTTVKDDCLSFSGFSLFCRVVYKHFQHQ